MAELVTIGIPCFNCERWIKATVESALNQSAQPTEIIVVDDGSTDGSPEILRNFGSAILHVRTENRGVNHARNEILSRARGEWLQYLDSDDYLLPSKIERQLAEADQPCEVIYSPMLIEEWKNGTASPPYVEPIDSNKDICAQLLGWELPQTGGGLWKTEALRRLGGWDEKEKVCDEHDLYLRALQHGMKFSFAPTPGAVYRIWSDTTRCRSDHRIVIESRTALLGRLQKWMQDNGLWTKHHARIVGRIYFEMARTLARSDLHEAGAYHADHKRRGLIHLAGPAAPRTYRIAYAALGFTGAEKLARALR